MNADNREVRADALDTSRDAILDIRMRPGRKQIRGALRYDAQELLAADRLVLPLPRENTIAVYGDTRQVVEAVVERLRKDGFNAAALEGGIEAWTDDGLPLEDVTEEQPIPGRPEAGIELL